MGGTRIQVFWVTKKDKFFRHIIIFIIFLIIFNINIIINININIVIVIVLADCLLPVD